jgi:hypothetical protein
VNYTPVRARGRGLVNGAVEKVTVSGFRVKWSGKAFFPLETGSFPPFELRHVLTRVSLPFTPGEPVGGRID